MLLSLFIILISYPLNVLGGHVVNYATFKIFWYNSVLAYTSVWGQYYGVERWLISHSFLLLTWILWLRYKKRWIYLPLACATLACTCLGGILSLFYGMYLIYGYQSIP